MRIKHLAAFICLGIMSTNSVLGVQAMGKVDPSKVVNGAAAPKKGASGVADRAVKLAGSAAVVNAHMNVEGTKGAVKGAVGAVGTVAVGSALLTGHVEVPAAAAVGGAAVGGAVGTFQGCKSGMEAAKYPQK